MNLQPNKQDAIVLPITNTRISASEWNQLVGSCMAFITAAGLTPDAADNEQFLNAFKIVAANLELVGANTNLSNLTATGQAKFDAKANTDLSNVSANIDYIIEYKNPTASDPSWYEVWRSGKVKQGGYNSNDGHTGAYTATITLLKPMADTNYCIYRTPDKGGIANAPGTQWIDGVNANTKTTTSFQFFTDQVGYIVGDFWMVIGQGA